MSSAESSHSTWHLVSLDKNSCLNLQQILEVFLAPISEEQAWAVLYQVFPTVILKGDIYYLYDLTANLNYIPFESKCESK